MFVFHHVEDHRPEKEAKKRVPKNPLVIDFSEDIHFHNYFRTTRVRSHSQVLLRKRADPVQKCHKRINMYRCV